MLENWHSCRLARCYVTFSCFCRRWAVGRPDSLAVYSRQSRAAAAGGRTASLGLRVWSKHFRAVCTYRCAIVTDCAVMCRYEEHIWGETGRVVMVAITVTVKCSLFLKATTSAFTVVLMEVSEWYTILRSKHSAVFSRPQFPATYRNPELSRTEVRCVGLTSLYEIRTIHILR
jgi:hypothetical protein